MTHPTPTPIITAARGWLGTRFVHQGRLKKTDIHKGGVDCLGLLVEVARELHITSRQGILFSSLDETNYSRIPDHQRLAAILDTHLYMKPAEAFCAGDIGLFSIQQSPQHLAIFSELHGQPSIIHAYAQARKVVEHPLDEFWHSQLVAVFRVP